MKKTLTRLAIGMVLLASSGLLHARDVSLTIDPDQVAHRIDEKVYGHFLEHIYHSVNGGLWGDLIWNRTFEDNNAARWSVEDGMVVQRSVGTDQRLTFGDPAWGDYEFTLEARKTGGSEGFLVLFRVETEKQFYWCNMGGWNNSRHQLERGREDRDRWGAVGPSADGRIEKDHWYRIKVRCEGTSIGVWLDGTQVIDFDDPRGHRTGAVGIGTWATQAQFRNMKVVSLDGKVLFEGLPQAAERPSLARQWQPFGAGRTSVEQTDALNGQYAQKIVVADGYAGIQQGDLCLRQGQAYRLSLWTRGEAPSGIVVRLLDGDKMLNQYTLARPGAQWKECTAVLRPTADADAAMLQIGIEGPAEVWIDQVSLMPQSWMEAGGFRPDLLQAIADLKPPIIRWPGGCFASAYRWKSGIGPQHKREVYPRELWDDIDVDSYGTDEFIAMCRKVGAEPLIVVNIGTESWNGTVDRADFIQEVRDWIQYCNGPADSTWGKIRAANGHPEPYGVTYWEIDNETWHMGAEDYAEAVRTFAPIMRQADPSIKLAACGSAGYGRGGNGLAWNRVVIEQCAELIDYISIHHYEGPDNFAQGPGNYERFFRQTGDIIAGSKNPDLKIYVSEWNAQSTDWRTGLYAGGLLNAFERCGDILEIGGPALFLRHVSATAWDNAFINFDQASWFAAPNYVVMKLFRDHYAPNLLTLTGDAGDLNVTATKSDDGRQVFVKAVNPTGEAVDVHLAIGSTFKASQTALQLVAPGSLSARNTLDRRTAVKPVSSPIRTEGGTVHFALPRWSVGVVTLTK